MKRICFTLNNYTEEDEQRIQQSIEFYVFAVYGRETAPSTGTKHLQGFINFRTKREFSRIKDIVGERAHIEQARGTDSDNQVYCKKDGSFWEHGAPVGQGKRTDLEECIELIKGGAELYDIVERYTSQFIRYPRGIERTVEILGAGRPGGGRQFKTGYRFVKLQFIVYVGETGSGKSRMAAELCKGESTYYKPHGKWWDGYNGQHNVVIDDFYGWIAYDEILRITDRYPHKVEVKGGFIEFTSKRLFIPSNERIEKWWTTHCYNEEKVKPIRRRLDIYEDFSIIAGEYIHSDLLIINNVNQFLAFE
ncbi:replication-associated protein [robinz virus RP_1170]|uniref:Replication-associated protein n=1 Tax=robinz virus RP_1170 TaxID=2886406 RepID=A0A8K1UFD9_9CIRC|nr:replication-associated protein [robinz virus RP_1170]UDN67424.1 replication-associated protein [robinz virus RP_1170]